MTRKLLALSSLALTLAFAAPALAQNAVTGAIQGVVNDKATGESLPGVTVVVTSPALQGTQSAITDGSGQYKITNLPPGIYSATFYYSDITVRRNNIKVSINKTTPAYVKMNTSQAGGEVIVIDDKAPSIDPTKTDQGIVLDQDYTRNIPVPGRTFEDTLGAAAGSSGDGLGVSFSGSSSLENQYVVDGVNTTGLTYGTVGSPLINEFIEEIEIITGGYNAEHGRSTGGVVNVVTKSGSNEFQGSVFSYVTPGFLRADARRAATEASSIDAEANLAYQADFGFELGGPIVKDKVWFYVGFAPQLTRVDIDKVTKRRIDCFETLPDGTLGATCDPVANRDGNADVDPETGFYIYEDLDKTTKIATQTAYQFVSKVNFAVSPEHQGQVSLIGTPASVENVGVRGQASATDYDASQLTTDLAFKWTSKLNDNKTEVEAVIGWHRSSVEADSIDNSFNDTPLQYMVFGDLGTWSMLGFESEATRRGCTDSGADDPYPLIQNCPDEGDGYSIGGPGGLTDDKEERLSARVSATQRIKAAGNHELKAGIDIENNTAEFLRELSGGTRYIMYLAPYNQYLVDRWIELAPPTGGDPAYYNQMCRDGAGLGALDEFSCHFIDSTRVKGNTQNWSIYARDSWQPMPNLTLNYGLRYEEQRLRYAQALQNTPDPYTGVSRGKNAMELTNMWAPRVGILYDWTKEGRSKVYGHWGRFYESIPMDINNRSFGGETFYRQNFDATSQCGPEVPGIGGPSATGCVDSGMPAANGETIYGSGVLVAPGIKAQFLDELILGVEYEVLEDLKLGLAYKNRRLGRILEDVSVDNADTYILANPGEVPADAIADLERELAGLDPNSAEYATLANQIEQFKAIRVFDKPRRDYNAIELTATKRFSKNFFAQGSYTYSRLQGNYPGLFSADNGQVDPNISSQFDLIELLANRDGALPADRPHYIKIDGYYNFDFKEAGTLTPGIRFRALSGIPKSALGAHATYGFNEAFLLPRGAMGRNGFDWSLDVRMQYGRKLGKGMTLSLFADAFSVFNTQGTAQVSQTYTLDNVNPVVGGDYSDLVFAKAQDPGGGETSDPVSRWRNFGNTVSRYAPFAARLGARLTF